MPAQPANSADKAREAAAARRRAAAQRSAGQSRPVAVKPAPAASTRPEPAQAAPVAAYAAPSTAVVVAINASANKAREAAERRRIAAQRSGVQARQRSRPTVAPAPAVAAYPTSTALEDNLGSLFGSEPVTEEAMDALCELVETDPNALGVSGNSVRAICRNRRQQLATQGKAAVPRRPGSRPVGRNPRMGVVPQGRDAARQHRVQAARGQRPDAPAAPRPTGRMRPQRVPPKVEVDETLLGNAVTGTQVSRVTANTVTGGEAGTCRAVTGTEYLGTDHFDTICGTRPEPNPPKVGLTVTGGGLAVSGTEVGRSGKVTGDEVGSCRAVTGTEYLGLEQFSAFCENKGLTTRAPKVVAGTTARKQLTVTGVDEARLQPVTGNEPGAGRSITGSQYSDAGAARLTINGPQKVALTHTVAGREVTGTEVGRSIKVTGDEYGSCRPVTGTEYVSSEQFQFICKTQAPARSAKVGEDNSQKGQRITGNLVNRTEKVTGNEATAVGKVTGSQYGDSQVANRAPPKAYPMQTLAGRSLTGNRVDHSPKLTGDDRGGCLPVTGTEYYGKEHFAQYCASEPPQQHHAQGHDHPHEHDHGEGEHGFCCDECAADHLLKVKVAQARRMLPPPPVMCHGCADSAVAEAKQAAQQAAASFSIQSPAQAALGRVTGNAYEGAGRITGPGNRGNQVVSGTPEFRYQQPAAATVASEPVATSAEPAASRVTGDGRDNLRITGDDWGRSQRMTGTEGRWAQNRNPTLRGMQPAMAMVNAHANKSLERPEAPPIANVTGSSGNSGKGALITVSGGARG
ncbi:MAG: CsoS2 family carboxysome shell protein [Candidatus Thiothrix putei]|uniref:CsoS2 family carboxysome shell protein n=1 Tax=Candidatus Thiothrix putei TaxID=3080811 RepID=A0AA95HD72_9GAMM|nr:MAG: CsoS2 family carboxysome shell protein [Candidatus Thiothrix putei]